MGRKEKSRRPRDVIREDVLRPSPHLGYDRYSIAMHCMKCGAFEIAESQLRRCVWLNPYEPLFAHGLAQCLQQEGRLAEAAEWARKAVERKPDDALFARSLRLIEEAAARAAKCGDVHHSDAEPRR